MTKTSEDSTTQALRQRLHRLETIAAEQQQELNQLKEAGGARLAQSLGLDTPKKRRQVLQLLATSGAVGVVGAGGFVAGTETAEADAVAADVGTEADPWQKVWTHEIESGDGASGVTIPAIAAGQINDNFINLTSLVEDGTYADIVDAIVNEPANHDPGLYYYIEPGTYEVSTGYTLTESEFAVGCPGHTENWNRPIGQNRNAVMIEWTGDATTDMLTIGDGATSVRGVSFENIYFVPENDDGGRNAIVGGGDSGSATRDIKFENCMFHGWGGNGIDIDSDLFNFSWKFHHCGFQHVTAKIGTQATFIEPYIKPESSTPVIECRRRSTWLAATIDAASGPNDAVGIRVGTPATVNLSNAEGPGSGGGAIGVEIFEDIQGPAEIRGSFSGWDIGVQAATEGTILGLATFRGTGIADYDFGGGVNSHNGTVLIGDIAPTDVRMADDSQRMRVVTSWVGDNVSAADVPAGMIIADRNRGGSGTDSMVVGSDNNGGPVRYIDFDGTV